MAVVDKLDDANFLFLSNKSFADQSLWSYLVAKVLGIGISTFSIACGYSLLKITFAPYQTFNGHSQKPLFIKLRKAFSLAPMYWM